MNDVRRTLCQTLGGWLAVSGLGACGQPAVRAPAKSVRSYTEEELRRMNKFRGIDGYDLSVHLYPKRIVSSRGLYCKIVDERGENIAAGIGIHTSRNGIPPLQIHATLHDDTDANWKDRQPVLIGEWTVPVADRIPDDLLDDLRRVPKGSLRIKVRLHREGVLLGWDIERRPGFNAQKSREGQHYPPAYSHTGGDFKEMRIAHYIDAKSPCQECVAFARNVKKTPYVVYSDDPNGYITMPSADDLQNQLPEVLQKNGYFLTPIGEVYSPHGSGRQLREKGWYIHPKTGQRIETDF